MLTVTLRFSPSAGCAPVAKALANSKTATAVLAGPSHNSPVCGSIRSRHTLASEGPPGHHTASLNLQACSILRMSCVTPARAVIDK
jgi:hypothetical protein